MLYSHIQIFGKSNRFELYELRKSIVILIKIYYNFFYQPYFLCHAPSSSSASSSSTFSIFHIVPPLSLSALSFPFLLFHSFDDLNSLPINVICICTICLHLHHTHMVHMEMIEFIMPKKLAKNQWKNHQDDRSMTSTCVYDEGT